MKATLFALFVALLMVGCGEPDLSDPDVVEDATADAVEWSKLQDRDGVTFLPNTQEPFSGYAKQAYENEQFEILALLKDGYVVRLKQWQENGTPRWGIGFVQGKVGIEGMPWSRPNENHLHGPAKAWHENGQKSIEVNYKDGKQEGLQTSWHENGQKKGEGNYKDGEKDGLETLWYENGKKEWEGNYKDGKLDGLWTYWYENGQKKEERTYDFGKLMSAKVWKPNGEKCPVTNVKDGNGVDVTYWEDEDGRERSSRNVYKDGEVVD
jgi:antitoxin component YwqK of YwqJK toxin-antitoxin module